MANENRNWMAMALGGAVLLGAIALGYTMGRSRDAAPPAPEVGAAEPAAVPAQAAEPEPAVEAAAPAELPPVEAELEASAPSRATAPAPRERPAATRAGERVASAPPAAAAAESGAEGADVADVLDEPAPEPEVRTAPPAPRTEMVTLEAGTPLRIRLLDAISSQTSAVDDPVGGELSEPVVVGGRTVFARGSRVRGRVTAAHPLAKVGGQAQLAVEFERVVGDLATLDIAASWARMGKSETGKDAATIAGGAAAGAILGNLARKNYRGKILGALIGAAAGAAIASKTPGEKIDLPAGTVLEVELAAPLEVEIELD